jgi:hypothetical protein
MLTHVADRYSVGMSVHTVWNTTQTNGDDAYLNESIRNSSAAIALAYARAGSAAGPGGGGGGDTATAEEREVRDEGEMQAKIDACQRDNAARDEQDFITRIEQEMLSRNEHVLQSCHIRGQDYETQQLVINRCDAQVIKANEQLTNLLEELARAQYAAKQAKQFALITASQAQQTKNNVPKGNTTFHFPMAVRHRGARLGTEIMQRIPRDIVRMGEAKFCRLHLVIDDEQVKRSIRRGGPEESDKEMAKLLLRLAMASSNIEVPMHVKTLYYDKGSKIPDVDSVENSELDLDGPDVRVVSVYLTAFAVAARATTMEAYWYHASPGDGVFPPFFQAVFGGSRKWFGLSSVQCTIAMMCYLAVPGGLRHMLTVAGRGRSRRCDHPAARRPRTRQGH